MMQQTAADPYVEGWSEHVAGPNGPVPGSTLSGPERGPWSLSYEIEMARGRGTFPKLLAAADQIATALGVRRDRLVFERGPRGAGAQRARMTLVTGDPRLFGRLYAGPRVRDGVIEGLGQHMDGRSEVAVTMWCDTGMVPTMIVGDRCSGRTAAADQLACGALSTEVMNLIYLDPAGEGSPALRARARVVLEGDAAGELGGELLKQLLQARSDFAALSNQDTLWPSMQMPGWMALHEDFGLVTGRKKVREQWARIANTVRSLGVWPVALNDGLTTDVWGDDQTRSAFAGQVIAFRVAEGSDGLVPGIESEPRDLPLDDGGVMVAGVALQAGRGRFNMPAKWDWLPPDGLPIGIEPRFRVSSAFDTFFRAPALHSVDAQVIRTVLGEPDAAGRWVVGATQ